MKIWSKELPTANGVYWYRLHPDSAPDIIQIHYSEVYYTAEAGATNLLNHEGGEFLGPISPDDAERLGKLTQAVNALMASPREISGQAIKEWIEHDLNENYGEFSTQWATELLIARFVDVLIAYGKARDEWVDYVSDTEQSKDN